MNLIAYTCAACVAALAVLFGLALRTDYARRERRQRKGGRA